MASSSPAVPQGYHSVTPYLAIDGAAAAIEFYQKAFGATEMMRMPGPGGKVGHAEIEIGGSRIMLADEYPDMNFRSPRAYAAPRSACISTWRTWTPWRDRRWPQAPRSSGRSRISSTATAPAASRTPTATSGTSRPARRTWRPTS